MFCLLFEYLGSGQWAVKDGVVKIADIKLVGGRGVVTRACTLTTDAEENIADFVQEQEREEAAKTEAGISAPSV